MGRPLRISVPGVPYHVTARGNNQGEIFVDEVDKQQYLLFLKAAKDTYAYQLQAYALMSNHVHLLLQSSERGSLSSVIHFVHGQYALYFNQRHHRVGHVFEARFFSVPISTDEYFFAALRYIHLNPVSAGIAGHPAAYPWTSYHAYREPRFNWLGLVDRDLTLRLFSTNEADAIRQFQSLAEPIPQPTRDIWFASLEPRPRGRPRKSARHFSVIQQEKVPGTF